MRLFRHPFGESVDVRFQGLGVLVVVQLFDGFLILFVRRQEVHHFEIKKVLCSPVSARNRLNYAKRPRRPECQYIAVRTLHRLDVALSRSTMMCGRRNPVAVPILPQRPYE